MGRKSAELEDLKSAEFLALDLETTGLDVKNDEIISIAMIPMTGLRIHIGKSFYSLIKPRKFHGKCIKIHGICPGDLEKAPTFEELHEKILDALTNRIAVGFDIIFDVAFLKESFKRIARNQSKKLDFKYVDIKEVEGCILRRAGKPVKPFDLVNLINKYQIEGGSRHNALSDAYIVARIFQKQLNALLEFEIKTRDLLQISRVHRL